MADIMKDLEAEPNQIQKGLGECQKHVAQVQSQLDQAVQGFGMAMQTGMQGCQQQAQNAMESGRPESGESPFSNGFFLNFFENRNNKIQPLKQPSWIVQRMLPQHN